MTGIAQVQLGKNLGLLKLVKNRGHEWKWVSILNSDVTNPLYSQILK